MDNSQSLLYNAFVFGVLCSSEFAQQPLGIRRKIADYLEVQGSKQSFGRAEERFGKYLSRLEKRLIESQQN